MVKSKRYSRIQSLDFNSRNTSLPILPRHSRAHSLLLRQNNNTILPLGPSLFKKNITAPSNYSQAEPEKEANGKVRVMIVKNFNYDLQFTTNQPHLKTEYSELTPNRKIPTTNHSRKSSKNISLASLGQSKHLKKSSLLLQ